MADARAVGRCNRKRLNEVRIGHGSSVQINKQMNAGSPNASISGGRLTQLFEMRKWFLPWDFDVSDYRDLLVFIDLRL
jgi:hypothetical protein